MSENIEKTTPDQPSRDETCSRHNPKPVYLMSKTPTPMPADDDTQAELAARELLHECRKQLAESNKYYQDALALSHATMDENNRLTKQRDALAEALREACNYPTTGNWYGKAQDALAAVDGKEEA